MFSNENQSTVYEMDFSGGGLKPINVEGLEIGDEVMNEWKGTTGVVVGQSSYGYDVLWGEGEYRGDGYRLNCNSPHTRVRKTGNTISLEEIIRRKTLLLENREKERLESEEKARQFKVEYERLKSELKQKYPFAAQKGSDYARGAKNLKAELRQAFPSVNFSVSSESYSGGSSIRVHWTDGVTTRQVEEFSRKYQYGSFDGMEDIYNYDSSAYSKAVREVLGSAKYVSEERTISEEKANFVKDFIRENCKDYDGAELNSYDLSNKAYRILQETDFTQGELDRIELIGHEFVIKFKPLPAPAVNTPKPAAAVNPRIDKTSITVTENKERNGIEIRFDAKPAESVLTLLKQNGWRWSKFAKCWYQRASSEARNFAENLTEGE